MKYTLPLFISCLILLGCKKENNSASLEPYQIYYLKSTVVQTSDISCSMPVLNFSEDSLRIRNLTNLNSLNYTAANLLSGYTIQNQKLYVSVAVLPKDEEFPCNTLGIMFPRLKVIDAKPRE